LFTVDVTCTLPGACAGVAAVHSVVHRHFTDVAAAVPNLTVVPVVPAANPVPLMITGVPPPLVPLVGSIAVIVGLNANLSLLDAFDVPPAVVTRTSTLVTGSSAVTAVIELGEFTTKLAALVVPKRTSLVPPNPQPTIVTAVPPPVGPLVEVTAFTTGT
jgi:hypothetical protein